MKAKIDQSLANNPNPVLSVQRDGTVLFSNKAGESLLKEWSVEVGNKLPSYIEDIVHKVISENSPKKMEVKAREKIYLVAFHPLPDEKCVNIYGFDISDQKEYEKELYESERRYHQLFENMLEGFAYCKMLYDDCGYPADFIYLGTNKAFEQLTGLKEVEGKRATELFPGIKESHPEIFDIYDRVALTGHPERFEIDFKPLGMWFSIYVYSMESEHFIVVFDNITERMKTDASIEKSRFILTKSQEMAHVGNWAWNVQTGEMNGSDENYRIYGYEPGYVHPSENWVMTRTHPDDRALLTDFFRSVKQDRTRKSLDYRIVRLDGDTRYVMTVADKIVRDKAGEVRWVYGITQDVTERMRAEEALRESEEKFRTLFENASAAIFVADIETGEIIDCNQNAEKLIGRPQREIIGLHQTRLHPADKEQHYRKMFANHLHVTGIKNYEAEVQHSDGRVIPALINAAPLKINGRNVMIGFFLDITESKQAEEALKKAYDNLEIKVKERTAELEKAYKSLKESEEGLAEAQKMAHIGNWSWDIATDNTYWSDELYSIFKRDPQEIAPTYNEYLSYIHPDDQDYVNSAFKKAIKGKPYSIDHRIILTNGEELTVHIQAEVVFDEKNIPVRIKGIVQDITERKRVEEKLRESEEKYRNIVETANESICLINSEGVLTYVNKKMADMTGYSIEEIIGKRIWEFVGKEDQSTVTMNMEKRRRGISESYEIKLICKDGSPLWVHVNAKPLFDGNGKFIGPLNMLTDINERKKAEEALANIETARKKEIHHRIKNNLQVISSLLDLQADKFNNRECIKDSEVLEAFKESQDRVISMALIHEELHKGGEIDKLNFSRYIVELAENLFLSYRLGNESINLDTDIKEDIFFDIDTAVPLGMIVNELVSNSLKYAFVDGKKGEIKIKLLREESNSSTFTLSISDNGLGIPEDLDIEDLDSLGLQLVTNLVEQLDGELELKRNNGTEFTIRFAVAEKNNQAFEPAPKSV